MSTMQQQTQPIRQILSSIIGETRLKSFFSYYAIFKDNSMLGLYKNGNFYLRISHKALEHTPWVKELTHLQDRKFGIHNKHLYLLPEHIIPNIATYQHLIFESIEEIQEIKKKNLERKKTLIRYLPNLNINIERILRRVGIFTVADFKKKGAINTFVEMVKIGIHADPNLLFKLYCALEHRYTYLLSNSEKLAILADANEALYNAGLRKRFKLAN